MEEGQTEGERVRRFRSGREGIKEFLASAFGKRGRTLTRTIDGRSPRGPRPILNSITRRMHTGTKEKRRDRHYLFL
jgi:hypothetical protein